MRSQYRQQLGSQYNSQMGRYNEQMGADCPPNTYRLKIFGIDTGQCVPDSGDVLAAATGAATGLVGAGVAQSPGTKTAALSIFESSLGKWVTNNVALIAGAGVAAAVIIYMLARKK